MRYICQECKLEVGVVRLDDDKHWVCDDCYFNQDCTTDTNDDIIFT